MNELDKSKETADFLDSLEEEDRKPKEKTKKVQAPPPPEEKASQIRARKLTQGQRFLVSFLFFMMVLVIGFFVMLITGKMVLPL